MSLRWWLPDPIGTARFGAAIAQCCPWELTGPRLLFLSGELGAGKTTLAAAVLGALGLTETVRSPSYALLEIYELGERMALHLDCFRLTAASELEQLGLRDYYRDRTLWLVEWPERGGNALPLPELALRLEFEGAGRQASIEAHGEGGIAWVQRLRQCSLGQG